MTDVIVVRYANRGTLSVETEPQRSIAIIETGPKGRRTGIYMRAEIARKLARLLLQAADASERPRPPEPADWPPPGTGR